MEDILDTTSKENECAKLYEDMGFDARAIRYGCGMGCAIGCWPG